MIRDPANALRLQHYYRAVAGHRTSDPIGYHARLLSGMAIQARLAGTQASSQPEAEPRPGPRTASAVVMRFDRRRRLP
jgi:hypothetical protein